MGNCANIAEQLLDYLYGLLDDEECARLQLHLQACPHCQAELREAEGQQRLIAQAALVCKDVAPFAAPEEEAPLPEPAILPMAPAASAPAGSAPAPTPRLPGKRFPAWIRYGSVALAASLLLGVVAAREVYLSGLTSRQKDLGQIRQEVDGIEAKFRQASSKFDQDRIEVQKPADVVQVSLTGTPKFDVNAGCQFNVVANSLAGNPQKAPLDVRLIDRATNAVLFKEEVLCQGENTTVTIPPGQFPKEMQLAVTPRTLSASPPLQCALQASEPVHLTHLALNKTSFYQRELLFFRSLTLEQFSLKPIARQIPLQFSLIALTDGEERVVREVHGKTGSGGIGGGELALADDIPAGNYVLEVSAPTDAGVLPQRRRLDILSPSSPQVVMEKSVYAPGEWAKGKVVSPSGGAITDQRIVPDIVQSGNQAASPPIPRTYTDEGGNFQVPLPTNLDAAKAQLNFRMPSRTSSESISTTINIVPSRVEVDFFPEGGDLIDGVATRVYYRVRSLQGDPVVPDGKVIVKTGSGQVLFESQQNQGVGVFAMIPRLSESYEVRLTSTRMLVANAKALEKLGMQKDGVILSVQGGVHAAGAAIETRLINKGGPRRLLILVACRGQVVEQQNILVNEGETKLELKPIAHAAGILRVSVFEVKDRTLVPMAERLVFRKPAHRLELAGNPAIHPGHNSFKATWCTESKQPADCYALAAVIDSQYPAGQGNDLASHFFLGNDVAGPAELENANVLVRDNPESWRALDLFLGTHGWRRFVAVAGQDRLPRNAAEVVQQQEAPAAAASPEPFLVNVQNASLADLQAQDAARVNLSQTRLADFHAGETAELARERAKLVAPFGRAAQELAEFERMPDRVLRTVLGSTLLLGLGLGVALMLAGFVRLLRGRLAAPVFAGSFAALGVCLFLMFTARPPNPQDEPALAKLDLPDWPAPAVAHLPRAPLQLAKVGQQQQHPLTIASAGPALFKDRLAHALRETASKDAAQKKLAADIAAQPDRQDGVRMARNNSEQQFVQNYGNQAVAYGNNALRIDQVELGRRFEDAAGRQKALSSPAAPAAPPGAGGGGGGMRGNKKDAKERDAVEKTREYAFTNSNLDRCDPMLWYPATILWMPALEVKNGELLLNFDLPEMPQSSYHVIIQAHTDDGRLGCFEKTLAQLPRPQPVDVCKDRLSMFERELQTALESVRLATDYLVKAYADFHAIANAPASITTEADRQTQEIILKHILSVFPGDALCAEETTAALKDRASTGDRLWIVDPIDGTRGFAMKNGEFSVMVGFVERGTIGVGVVGQPAVGRLTFAVQGGGCWRLDGSQAPQRCRVTDVAVLSQATLTQSRSRPGQKSSYLQALQPACVVESYSAGIKLALVARGEADVYLNTYDAFHDWDICAGHILVAEAGGQVTGVRGETLRYGLPEAWQRHGLLASNGKLHDEAVQKIMNR